MFGYISSMGCSLLPVLGIIAVGVLTFFIGSSTANTVEQSLVLTLPPQETDAYFILEDNLISYAYSPTLGQPCYYIISGRVLDQNNQPFIDYVANIQMIPIEDVAPEETGYAFPGDGSYAEDGPSGWSTLLPSWGVSYEVWLTDEVDGRELSDRIIVPARDCDQNRAIVNFVQNRPLP